MPPTPADDDALDRPGLDPGGDISRRAVLRAGAVGAVGLSAAGLVSTAATASAAPTRTPVFVHGVASGDPTHERVILWTRITPTPDVTAGSGRGLATSVRWEVAPESGFATIVTSGTVTTGPDRDHTVKVDVGGLSPATRYLYRFTVLDGPAAGAVSPTGHTKTVVTPDSALGTLRLGVVSCSNWEAGYFSAYRHLADQPDLDAIVHLGDYIYEYKVGEFAGKFGVVRPHEPRHEIISLQDYRIRHGQYKTDPDLARLHAKLPWITTWDDHESANDSYKSGAQNHNPGEGDWRARKANSEQAYYEWMPVRPAVDENGRHIYRRFRFGTLAELSMLDLRTYRDRQVGATSATIDDPRRSITGAGQMKWLETGLATSPTRWQIVGNPVMITPVLIPPLEPTMARGLTELLGLPAGGVTFNADAWDGYTMDRKRLLDTIRTQKIDNVVFITGDIHTSWAADVPVDPANYPAAGTVATELVGTSVTSKNIDDFIRVPEHSVTGVVPAAIRAANNHVKFMDPDAHGYSVLTVTPAATQMDWYFVREKTDPRTGQYRGASFRVPDGVPRVQPVNRAAR
ncbi:alkaline phosphatase D family protein [Williamsia sp. CHRR-6]|nr:alkaline phosphatase D family protein [Williamsia sp. CHRR-6]